MREKLSQPTSIRLPRDLRKRLKQLAVARRQPLSLMIVYVLEQWAAQFPPSAPTKVEK